MSYRQPAPADLLWQVKAPHFCAGLVTRGTEVVRAHAADLRRRGYDELAVDLLDELDGDPPDADCDAYGRYLV